MLCVCFHDTTVPGVRPSLMERWLWVVGSSACAVILVHGVHAKVRVMQVLTSWPKGSTSSPTEKVKKKRKKKKGASLYCIQESNPGPYKL